MFGFGQIMGLAIVSLLFGAIVQSYGKRKQQPELGNMGLIVCTAVTFLAGFAGIHLFVGLATMAGFILAISSKK
jgi:4-hydroxybenzoate polyprenyltransferase